MLRQDGDAMREVPDRPMPTDAELDHEDEMVCSGCGGRVRMTYIEIAMVGVCGRCGEEITRV